MKRTYSRRYCTEVDIGCSERHIDFLEANIVALEAEGYDAEWQIISLRTERLHLKALQAKLETIDD